MFRSTLARTSVAFIAGGLATVTLTGTAAAAVHYLQIGASNSSSRTTTLSSRHGAALALKSPAKKPSLTVSNKVQIPNLNASLLDGNSAGVLVNAARTHFQTVVAALSKGAAVAHCPTGWHPTGGGVLPTTATGAAPPYIAISSASVSNGSEDGWLGAAVGDAQYTGAGFVWVDCTNGPYVSASASSGTAALRPQLTKPSTDSADLVAQVRAQFDSTHAR
jgi:hypothetical protein